MSPFFEDKIVLWKLELPKRLLASVIIVLAAKLSASVLIYYLLNVGSVGTFWTGNNILMHPQNQIFLLNTIKTDRWLNVFLGWDSAWYLSILTKGYAFSSQSYSFFPGFPLFGGFFNLFFGDPVVSLVFCSLFFGVLWVPIYQLVAEFYMSKKAALLSALLFALSPYAFLFTTIAYSEGILLFFVLTSWYFFKKGKIAFASALACVAALSRVVGILIILPMLIETLKSKSPHRRRNILLICLPILSFFVWLAYGQVTANDWLALIHTTEWTDLYSFQGLLTNIVPLKGFHAFLEVPFQHWLTPFAIWGSIILPPFLIAKTFKTERSLASYSLAYFIGALVFGALVSIPRFIAVIFPLWIALTAKIKPNKKSTIGIIIVLILFFTIGVDLWITLLNGYFIA